jgi:hypothetical protein
MEDQSEDQHEVEKKVKKVFASMIERGPKRSRVSGELRGVLEEQHESVKAAVAVGWTPTAIAQELRKEGGFKVGLAALRKIVMEIVGVRQRRHRKDTKKNASVTNEKAPT